jgi:aspartate racemase
LADYVDCLHRKDINGIANLMVASAHKLAKIGADFLICPDNTIHQAFPLVARRLPLPWLHIAEVVATAAADNKYRRVGLTGTSWLVDSEVYPEKLITRNIEFVRPSSEEKQEINRIIMDELVYSIFKPAAIDYFYSVTEKMKHQGCDAVILGCTELPLIINDQNSSLPTLDSTRLLARAALHRAVYQ